MAKGKNSKAKGGLHLNISSPKHFVQYYENDVFFLKLNGEGCITKANQNVPEDRKQFLVFPNPCSQEGFYIRTESKKSKITFSDINGRILFTSNLKEGDNYFKTDHLTSGIYIAIITGEQANHYYQKITIL